MLSIVMLVEIINPVINEMTKLAIDSIIKNTFGEWELICYVHGQERIAFDGLADCPTNVHFYHSDKSYSVAEGYNAAAKHTRGDILCILHNDIIFASNGWNAVMERIAKQGDIAFPMIDESMGNCELRGVGKTEPWQTSSCCYMLSMQLWNELQGLDEDFKVMHGEDIDLFVRAQKLKRKLVRCDSLVMHHRGVTRSFSPEKGNDVFFANWHKFNMKHQTVPGEHINLPRLSETPEVTSTNMGIGEKPRPLSHEIDLINLRKKYPPAINLGCGALLQFDDSFNADKYAKADIQLEAEILPFHDESCGILESHQLLEHISYHDTEKTLKEWYRCLKTDGKIIISVPNMENILSSKKGDKVPLQTFWHTVMLMIYGTETDEGQYHKAGFVPDYLKEIMESVGFKIEDIWVGFPNRPTPSFTIIGGKENVRNITQKDLC